MNNLKTMQKGEVILIGNLIELESSHSDIEKQISSRINANAIFKNSYHGLKLPIIHHKRVANSQL